MYNLAPLMECVTSSEWCELTIKSSYLVTTLFDCSTEGKG